MFPFEVDPTTDVPPWVQLRQRLIYLINSGYFKPGDKLPTVRGLASDVSINYNTVNRAYRSLVSDGYLESTRGGGVYVRDVKADGDDGFGDEVDGVISDFIGACRDLGLPLDDIQRRVAYRIQQMKFEEMHGEGDEHAEQSGARIVEIGVDSEGRSRKMG